jgi:DNA polymerase-1
VHTIPASPAHVGGGVPEAYVDQETFLLEPRVQAPPIVCLQFAIDDGTPELIHRRDPAFWRTWEFLLTQCRSYLHNASFDLACLLADSPERSAMIFDAYAQDRIACTIVRQKLLDIARGDRRALAGKNRLSYDLGSVARRLQTGIELNKEDPWRLRYGTLWGVDVAQWPAEAVRYALDDCVAQRLVARAQGAEEAARGQAVLPDQFRQARKDFWLRLMSCWGFATDSEQVERYAEQVVTTLDEDTRIAKAAQLVRDDGTRNLSAAMTHMVRCCEESEEIDLPLTAKGFEIADAEGLTSWQVWAKHRKYVELSEDAIGLYGDETLEAYQRYSTAKTRVARVERLRNSPIQASFDSLVDTGRTSCRQGDTKPGQKPTAWGAQLQNPMKAPGYRECFVPRKGRTLVSIDYNSLELRTWSQVMIWTVKHSAMAEVLNTPGRCPHTEFASTLLGVSADEGYARRKAGDKEFERNARDPAKNCNFGFLGGMGPKKFVITVRKGGGGQIEIDQAKRWRRLWLAQWRAQDYFDHISGLFEAQDKERIQMTHFKSERLRGLCYYTQACNTLFQGLAADIASDAGMRITRECYDDRRSPLYGTRLCNHPHDEFLLDVPDDRLHEASYRATQLMLDAGHAWCPDLKFTAEPASMDRWSKAAKTLRDAHGRLIAHKIDLAPFAAT